MSVLFRSRALDFIVKSSSKIVFFQLQEIKVSEGKTLVVNNSNKTYTY